MNLVRRFIHWLLRRLDITPPAIPPASIINSIDGQARIDEPLKPPRSTLRFLSAAGKGTE